MPRAMSHDEWYAFIESLVGLREDTASRNPGSITEIRTLALELSEHPNPFDTIEELRQEIAQLKDDQAGQRATIQALKKKVSDNARPKRSRASGSKSTA